MPGYSYCATEFSARPQFGMLDAWRRLLARRAPRLETESLPDYLKKDLGFLDGRVAMPRDPLRD